MDKLRDFGDFIMNYYAQINELGTVENIVVADGGWIALQSGNWVKYLDENPAYIGGSYNYENNVFIAPQPFPSWTLDENHDWQPPAPRPEGKGMHIWNEESMQWEETL